MKKDELTIDYIQSIAHLNDEWRERLMRFWYWVCEQVGVKREYTSSRGWKEVTETLTVTDIYFDEEEGEFFVYFKTRTGSNYRYALHESPMRDQWEREQDAAQ